MEALWYILLFAFKWIFIGLVYFVLFTLLRTVQYEMGTRVKSVNAQPSGAPGRLEVMKNRNDGQNHLALGTVLNLQPETTLGSDPANNIVLDDPYVSGRHARMSWDGVGWSIEDLDSQNGTSVNGLACRPYRAQPVPFGATVSLGGMAFKLRRE